MQETPLPASSSGTICGVHAWHVRTIWALTALSILTSVLQSPELPDIASSLGGSGWDRIIAAMLPVLPVVVNGVAGLCVLLIGSVRSRFFPVISVALFIIAGLLPLVTPNTACLLVSRVIFGFSALLATVSSDTFMHVWSGGKPDARKELVSGSSAVTSGLACVSLLFIAIAGGAVFPFLESKIGGPAWRWPFALYVLTGVLVGAALLRQRLVALPDTTNANTDTAADVTPERRRAYRIAAKLAVQIMLWYAGFYVMFIEVSQWMHHHVPDDPKRWTAIAIAVFAGSATPANRLVPRVLTRCGPRHTQVIGFLVTGVGYLIASQSASLIGFLLGVLVAGIGSVAPFQVAKKELLDRVPKAHITKASSLFIGIGFLGAGIGPLLVPFFHSQSWDKPGLVLSLFGGWILLLAVSPFIFIRSQIDSVATHAK